MMYIVLYQNIVTPGIIRETQVNTKQEAVNLIARLREYGYAAWIKSYND